MVVSIERIAVSVSEDIQLDGLLCIPERACWIVVFAHGSGSDSNSPRNHYVSQILNDGGFATLLLNLLSKREVEADERTRRLRFDIKLLTKRLISATNHFIENNSMGKLPLGYFGSSTGAAAALDASTANLTSVRAVVSRGGRVDLASEPSKAKAPILLLVGGNDLPTIIANQRILNKLKQVQDKKLVVVPGAGHLFEEPGKIEEVARHASSWFERYLPNLT